MTDQQYNIMMAILTAIAFKVGVSLKELEITTKDCEGFGESLRGEKKHG